MPEQCSGFTSRQAQLVPCNWQLASAFGWSSKRILVIWWKISEGSTPEKRSADAIHPHSASNFSFCRCSVYGTIPFTNAAPFGVPTPVTLSHPGVTVSDESVPNVSTNQAASFGLLKSAL